MKKFIILGIFVVSMLGVQSLWAGWWSVYDGTLCGTFEKGTCDELQSAIEHGELGTLEDIKCVDLRNSPGLTGDIGVFRLFPYLEAVRFAWCPNLKGDISSLSCLTNLKELSFCGDSGLTGDLSSLSSLINLECLAFFECSWPEGDISSLSCLIKLKTLGLSGSNLRGDIKSLKSLSDLEGLQIGFSCKITGDLTSLILGLPNLKEIRGNRNHLAVDYEALSLVRPGIKFC